MTADCNCGGGHAISQESPSGHAVNCPVRADDAYDALWQIDLNEVTLRARMSALADDLDYYASKSEPESYAAGLREAAWKIRKVIDGADPHEDAEDDQ